MSAKNESIERVRLERILAILLRYGTWLASAIITLGILWGAPPSATQTAAQSFSSVAFIKTGIALFIALPILRLFLMLCFFLHQRDYVFGTISTFVLIVIGLGLLLGVRH